MHYLLTGGCGFIGSHLGDALTAHGHSLTILDDLSTGRREHVPHGAELIVGDIADAALVRRAMQGKDGCFHLAAIASVERSRLEWRRTHAVNLTGTVNVFAAAVEAGNLPVVYASSAAVYGDNPHLPLTEESAARPLSPYGADKLGCELHGAAGARVHGLPNVGLRFFNCYGPRQDPLSPYSGVISIFARKLSEGQPITINGDGTQTRDFIEVGDVAAHLLAAMDALHRGALAQGVFNVCTGHPTSLLELASTLAGLCGAADSPAFGPARAGDIKHSLGSPVLATAQLGVSARVTLREGLRNLLAQSKKAA